MSYKIAVKISGFDQNVYVLDTLEGIPLVSAFTDVSYTETSEPIKVLTWSDLNRAIMYGITKGYERKGKTFIEMDELIVGPRWFYKDNKLPLDK